MTISLTGHAEIDHQHELLDSTVGCLARFCSEAERNPGATCGGCSSVKKKHCRSVLGSITGDLMAILAGHAAYEEKMMELLPATPSCQAHIKAHKAAHDGIMKRLKKLRLQIVDDSHPRNVGAVVMREVGDWLNDHSNHFDTRLVSLGGKGSRKIDFDSELVTMLDRHVFPNRPVRLRADVGAAVALRSNKLEVRGRFECLSPAQRQIYWLVISGKTNREIADELHVSINTVKTHRAAVFQKMDVTTALELVKKADLLR